jgi:hypothetical protein
MNLDRYKTLPKTVAGARTEDGHRQIQNSTKYSGYSTYRGWTQTDTKQYQKQWLQHVQSMDTDRYKTGPKTVATARTEFGHRLIQNSTKNSGYSTYRGWTQTDTKQYHKQWLQHVQRMDTDRYKTVP